MVDALRQLARIRFRNYRATRAARNSRPMESRVNLHEPQEKFRIRYEEEFYAVES